MAKKSQNTKPVEDISVESAEEMTAQNKVTIDEYLLECVTIEPTMLNDEFTRMPVDMAHWNERHNTAIRDYLLKKHAYDQVRARVLLEVREEVTSSGAKKTVGDIEAMVTIHPEVADAYLELIEADAERQALRNRCAVIDAKREMLQSLGAKLRTEMMSDPALRDQIIAQQLK